VARVTVYDALGRARAVLLDHEHVASRHELLWDGTGLDGSPLPSGLYVVCLEALNAREGVLVTAKCAVGIVR
jgi:flagellar hook assembly protein FlgD